MAFSTVGILAVDGTTPFLRIQDDTLNRCPEMMLFPANRIPTREYTIYRIKDADGQTVFRAPDTAKTWVKPVGEAVSIATKTLDASWWVDVASAEGFHGQWNDANGQVLKGQAARDAWVATMTDNYTRSAFKKWAKQLWGGTGADAAGFAGIPSFIDAAHTVGTATAGDSQVFAVNLGLNFTSVCWGNQGSIYFGPVTNQLLGDLTSGLPVIGMQIVGWSGVQCQSSESAAVAYTAPQDPTDTKNTGVTDNVLADLIGTFQEGFVEPARNPREKGSVTAENALDGTVIFMNRTALAELKKSRTAFSPQGIPAPYPTDFEGIPIVLTGAIGPVSA